METYDLSILVPGIRINNWKRLYDSIVDAFSGKFELIFVGPYDIPAELQNIQNVKYIKDWGSPMRCQQIGLIKSRGQHIFWAADDAVFVKNSIDNAFNLLKNRDYHEIVIGKYTESENPREWMLTRDYYIIGNHHIVTKYIPSHWYLFMVGLVNREYAVDLGGWDCRFEATAMGHIDFGIRAQRDGANCILGDVMLKCGHMPADTGDHGPIHYRQTEHDEPLFNSIYTSESALSRTVIDKNSWENCPSVWKPRFGDKI